MHYAAGHVLGNFFNTGVVANYHDRFLSPTSQESQDIFAAGLVQFRKRHDLVFQAGSKRPTRSIMPMPSL